MDKSNTELLITLSVDGNDTEELDELSRQLKSEVEQLEVEAVNYMPAEKTMEGTKSADWINIGQIVVTLAPAVLPPLFNLAKSWIERKPSTPVKIKIKVGKKTAQIEYDPTQTSLEELDKLVKSLTKSIKR